LKKNENVILELLMNLDYVTLEAIFKAQKVPNSHVYREMFLACNAVIFMQIREKLMHTIWEKKQLH